MDRLRERVAHARRPRRSRWCAAAGAPPRAGTRACAASAGSGRCPGRRPSRRPRRRSACISNGWPLPCDGTSVPVASTAQPAVSCSTSLCVVRQRVRRDDLDRVEARAVVTRATNEMPGLRVAPGAHPALDRDRRVRRRLAGQDRAHAECCLVHGSRLSRRSNPARSNAGSPVFGKPGRTAVCSPTLLHFIPGRGFATIGQGGRIAMHRRRALQLLGNGRGIRGGRRRRSAAGARAPPISTRSRSARRW